MNVALWLVALAFLWSTGALVSAALRLRGGDVLVRVATQFALGLAVWPILFLATTTLRIGFSPLAMRIVVLAIIACGCAVAVVRVRRMRWSRVRPARALLATFALLAILSVATRLSHIQGLAFPPWVDGVHHAMIVRLILENGLIPATADPYITGAGLVYHWGMHVPAVFVAAAIGMTDAPDTPGLLLQYGQMLNALSLLMVYAAGRVLLRSREGGLLAAVLATFISYYPAFYLSWGRYTHLAGTLLLPPLLIALWRSMRARRPAVWMVVVAVLSAGLVLTHVRIALFAAAFAIPLLFAMPAQRVRTVLRWGLAALAALILTSPWLLVVARSPNLTDVIAPAARDASMDLVASTRNRELFALATGGISGMAGWLGMPMVGRALSAAWWIAIVILSRRNSSRREPWNAFLVLGGGTLVLWIVLAWRPPGLDLSGFASLDSAIITAFLPLSLFGAGLVLWFLANTLPRLRGTAFFALVLALAVAGALSTSSIVNPATVFTDAADLRALRWVRTNVPKDARFAVESREWMPPSRVGLDAGYWLHVSTGRASILPPLLYAWSLPRERVDAINATLLHWASPSPDWRALRSAGVTHIFIGSHGSDARRRMLLSTNRVRPLYRDGRVLVFQIR